MLCGGRVLVEHAPNGACVLSRALAPPSPNFWDPAGFTSDGGVEDFKRRRQTELKHGRISMLATMGYITPEKLFGNQCPLCGCEKNTQTQVVLRWQHGNMCNLLC